MGAFTLVVLLSIACRIGSGAVIQLDGQKQELFLWQQKLHFLTNRLHSECPSHVEKRAIESNRTLAVEIDIAKGIYGELLKKYVQCNVEKSKGLATSIASTKADVSTTVDPTTTVNPTTTVKLITTFEPTITTTPAPPYRDCQEYYERGYRKSGVYMIKLSNGNLPAFNVWCDFINNHGWTVIQRRNENGNESVSFFPRDWKAYTSGFGDIDGEHWMGNERIHFLTMTNQQLNILVISKSDGQKSGIWKKFVVAAESDQYRLTIDGSGYTGDLVDKFSPLHNGREFTTSDRDNDNSSANCAAWLQGGWWYANCYDVDLNRGIGNGMYWTGLSNPFSLSVMRVTRD